MIVWQSSDSTHKMIKHEIHEIGVFIDLLACLNS